MTGFWLAVNLFAVYRLAILASRDKITEPVRKWVWRRGWRMEAMQQLPDRKYRKLRKGPFGIAGRWLYELVICPWCVSMWFAGWAIALTELAPAVWKYPALVLALSGFTVLATRRDE